MRRLRVGQRGAVEAETLRNADRPADLTLDAHVAVEVHGNAAAKVVVAEAGTGRVLAFREERASTRNDGDLDAARPRRRFTRLRDRLRRPGQPEDGSEDKNARCAMSHGCTPCVIDDERSEEHTSELQSLAYL